MDEEEAIHGGCILLARQTLNSDIWKKPTEYLKIWLYVIMKVNHKDNKLFPRGSNFFNWSEDVKDLVGIKKTTVENCVRWLKATEQITTQKTTRGMVIKVNNYDKFQDLDNYKKQNRLQNTSEPSEGEFVKPTLEEVTQYCDERGNNIDPEGFIDYYVGTKWRVGKNKTPMKDWKSTVRTWERNDKQKNKCSGLF